MQTAILSLDGSTAGSFSFLTAIACCQESKNSNGITLTRYPGG